MVAIPAVCEAGHVFSDRSIVVEGDAILSLGSNFTACPICRRRAKLIEGLFQLRDDSLIFKNGPSVSLRILRELRPAIQLAVKSSDVAELEKAADSIDRSLGEIVRSVYKQYPRSTIVIGIIALMLSCSGVEIKFDANRFLDQLLSYSNTGNAKDDEAEEDSSSTGNRTSEEKTDLERHD